MGTRSPGLRTWSAPSRAGRLQSPTRLPSRAGESNSSTRIRPSRFLAATAAVYQLTLVTGDERLLHAKGFAVMANR